MSRGLAVPVGVNKLGATVMLEGDEDAAKTISLALSDNDSDNAFQQGIGLDHGQVFAGADSRSRALILSSLYRLFAVFEKEKKFKLKTDTIKWGQAEGEQILTFKYVDMESDEVLGFQKAFRAGGGVSDG